MNYLYLFLLSAGLVLIQCLIGGTRMLFSFPTYAIVASAAVLSIISLRRPISKPALPALIATVLLAAYVVVRASFSPVLYLARPDTFMAAGCLIVYLLTALHLTETRHRLWVAGVLFIIAGADVVVSAIQFSKNHVFMLFGFIRPDNIWRASGMFISGNHLAGYLEAVAMFALGLTFWSRLRLPAKLLTGYLALMCYLGVALSGSRGGYISTTFSILVFAALSVWIIRLLNRKRLPLTILWITLAVLVTLGSAGAILVRQPQIRQRLTGNHLTDVRRYNWMAALDQFRLSPWVGTGAGTHLIYGRLFRRVPIQNDPIHAHGDYLELLAEYGAIGELLAILFLVTHLTNGLKGAREIATRRLRGSVAPPQSDTLALNLGALSAVAALLSHSVVDFNMHIPGNALVFSFIFGILANPGIERPPTTSPDWVSPTTILRFALLIVGISTLATVIPKLKGERLSEQTRIALRDNLYLECDDLAALAIEAQPENPYNYFYKGESNRVQGLTLRIRSARPLFFKRAADAYLDGLKYFPQDENLLVRYAQALDGLGQYDEADQAYQTALRWDPNLSILYGYYGAHLRLTGQNRAASKYYDVAHKMALENATEVGMAEVRSLLAPTDRQPSPDQPVEENH